MKVIIALLLCAHIFILANAGVLSTCPYQYQQLIQSVSSRCIELCQSPIYNSCPKIISTPPVNSNSYCGYTKSGEWKPFSYTCEACQAGVVGYFIGACDCSFVTCQSGYVCNSGICILPANTSLCNQYLKCPRGQTCDNGFCKISTCSNILCPSPLELCAYGICYTKPTGLCSTSENYQRQYCPQTRPTEAQCPTYQGNNKIPNLVCGVTITGEYIDFDLTCSACKIAQVQYVFNTPCSNVRVQCSGGKQCVDNYCQSKCGNNFCKSHEECINGRCALLSHYCTNEVSCISGYECQNYRCYSKTSSSGNNGNNSNSRSCQSNSDCHYFEGCVHNKCKSYRY